MSIKALVIGNLGYVGCVLNKYLFEESVDVYGVDANWFGDDTLLNNQKKYTCSQIINDIRNNYPSHLYYLLIYGIIFLEAWRLI